MRRGDRYVVYPDLEPWRRLYLEVRRVAHDGSWADVAVCTWAVMWTKRMPTPGGAFHPDACATPYAWDQDDLDTQEQDHVAMLDRERKSAGQARKNGSRRRTS